MKRLLAVYIESRRAARRTRFAVAVLRKEAARARRDRDKSLGDFLSGLADLIEATP